MSHDTEQDNNEETPDAPDAPQDDEQQATRPDPAAADEADTGDQGDNDDDPLFGPDASDEELDLLAGQNGDADDGDRLAELEAELADMKDKFLRAAAETENVRRRAQRDKEDAGKYGIASFAREMLSVSDNLARALDSENSEEEKHAKADLSADQLLERFAGFVEGVQLTESQLQKTFERIGIEKIEPVDQPFDPKMHHAMFEIEDLEKPSGTVLQVLEAGYVLHGRLLREAKVGVSKGGPKPDVATPVQESDPGEAEGAAQAYEQPGETGAKIDREL